MNDTGTLCDLFLLSFTRWQFGDLTVMKKMSLCLFFCGNYFSNKVHFFHVIRDIAYMLNSLHVLDKTLWLLPFRGSEWGGGELMITHLFLLESIIEEDLLENQQKTKQICLVKFYVIFVFLKCLWGYALYLVK